MEEPITKQALRKHMKQLRSDLDYWSYRKWSNAIMERCLDLAEVAEARTVHLYVSALNNEVDTLGLILILLEQGKIVTVPRCRTGDRGLDSIRITSLDDLARSAHGLMEPAYDTGKLVEPGDLELIFMPLLAFDRAGGRLGFGGGNYDALAASSGAERLGLAYSFQEVDRVPVEPHDWRLDCIVTEQEIIRVSQ